MDFLLVIFICFIVVEIRLIPFHSINEGYLSLDNTYSLRGILAIAIVLHHISEKVSNALLFTQLIHVGYMIVAVFFFLSGYGLMKQYKKLGKEYLKSFWKKRISFLVIIYLVVTVIYAFFRIVIGEKMTLYNVAIGFIDGHPIAANSWYIIVQILFYVFFWISAKTTKSDAILIVEVFILTTLINLLFYCIGYSSIWYMSNYAFALGMLWEYFEQQINTIIKTHYSISLLALLFIFVLFSALPKFLSNTESLFSALPRMISSCAITLVLIIMLMKIRFVGKTWKWIGKISLDIYLLHAVAYMSLRSQFIYIQNDVVWTVLTLAITITIAWIGNMFSSKIHAILKN